MNSNATPIGSHIDIHHSNNSALKKRLQVVDFEDCFHVQKEKDFIQVNKKNLSAIQKKIDIQDQQELLLDSQQKPKQDKTVIRSYMIKSPMDREKEKLQLQLDSIKKIILSNPYKYSNYLEHNSALVPERLINRNLVDPSPVFDEEEEEENKESDKNGQLYSLTQVKEQNKKPKKKHQAMIKQYQLFNKQGGINPNKQGLSKVEIKMPLGFKEKLEILQEEREIFGDEKFMVGSDLSPINRHLRDQRLKSQNNESDSEQSQNPLYPKYSTQKVSFKQNSISIMDPSVQQLETIQFPDILIGGTAKRKQNHSYVPDIVKNYLQKKNNLEFVQSNQMVVKKRQQQNRTSLDQRLQDTMNHSGILLKQAKDIITEAQKNTSSNVALLKLSKDLKSHLIKQSPSQLTLQRNLFEHFDDFKMQSRLNKFQVEDLYIKRENGLPMEILEEIERQEEIKQQYILEMTRKSNNPSTVNILQKTHQNENVTLSLNSSGINNSRFKTSQNSPDAERRNEHILQQEREGYQELQQIDIFNLYNNINKFSYKNILNEKEIRELKVQKTHNKFKTLEKQIKQDKIKKEIELFQKDKERKEKAMKQIREGVKVVHRQDSQSVIKLPLLPRQKYQSPLQLRNNNTLQYNTIQQQNRRSTKDQSTDIGIIGIQNSSRRIVEKSQAAQRQDSLGKWDSINGQSNENINGPKYILNNQSEKKI